MNLSMLSFLSRTAGLAGLLLLAGCGTIIQGTTQQVSVSSNPTDARIFVDGQPMGQTPLTLALSRKDRHVVRLELDGYQPYELAMSRTVSGWVAGNIVFGGLVGLAVDAITGGMYKLTPDQVGAEMRRTGVASTSTGGRLFVSVVLEPRPDWQPIGRLDARP